MIDIGKVRKTFSENDGFWVDYPDSDGVRFKIRPMYPEKASEFTRKSTKIGKSGNKEFDSEKMSRISTDYMIADWDGIIINGEKAECNPDNKMIVVKFCEEISRFIINQSNELSAKITRSEEDELKN